MESMTQDIRCSGLYKGNFSILRYINTTEQTLLPAVWCLLLTSLEVQCIRNQMKLQYSVWFLCVSGVYVCVCVCRTCPHPSNIINFRIKLNRLHFSSTSSISIYTFLKLQQNHHVDHRNLFFLKMPQQCIYKLSRMKC